MKVALGLLLFFHSSVYAQVAPDSLSDTVAIEEIVVEPARTVGQVSPFVYGQFLEHIYNSVVDGLWGQLVRGPSFEEAPESAPAGWTSERGWWYVDGGTLTHRGPQADSHMFAGSTDWTDYTFAVEAMKEGGAEGFLIIFRAQDNNDFYWWNLGGWGNQFSVVEREENGARRMVAGTRTETRIESGRWYRIEVRVQGSHVECRLDGETLCSFEDAELGAGRVGLGAWDTAVRYKNIRVSHGDETLFAPDLAAPQSADTISGAWYAVGEAGGAARYAWSDMNPLNSGFCQHIETDAGAGIGQRGLSVEAGVPLAGSVWLRGSGTVGVALSAAGASETCRFDVDSGAWLEYPIRFSPATTTADAELTITLEGAGDIWVDQCTLMRTDTPYRPAVYRHVQAIRPTFLRWPGGCYAQFYRWKDGIGPMKDRVTKPNYVWGGLDPNYFGTIEFLALCERLGAEPIIVINIGQNVPGEELGKYEDVLAENLDEYIQEALDWWEYCNGGPDTPYGALRVAHGHPEPFNVKYWEIGNETWPLGVEVYAERAKRFVEAFRAKDAGLQFLICGSAGHDIEWNRRILELAATHMDFLSVHHYMGGGYEAEMADGVAYPEFLSRTADLVAESANPAIAIAVTEWNQQSITLRTGLYAGLVLNGFERYGDAVTMSCPALFIRKTTALHWNNALIHHDSHRSFVAPNYVVMKLYRDNYAPSVVYSAAPPSLNVVATYDRDADECILKVVNPSLTSDVRARFRVGGAHVKPSRIWRVWAEDVEAANSLECPELIQAEEISAGTEEVAFPAHSVTVLRFAAGGATDRTDK